MENHLGKGGHLNICAKMTSGGFPQDHKWMGLARNGGDHRKTGKMGGFLKSTTKKERGLRENSFDVMTMERLGRKASPAVDGEGGEGEDNRKHIVLLVLSNECLKNWYDTETLKL